MRASHPLVASKSVRLRVCLRAELGPPYAPYYSPQRGNSRGWFPQFYLLPKRHLKPLPASRFNSVRASHPLGGIGTLPPMSVPVSPGCRARRFFGSTLGGVGLLSTPRSHVYAVSGLTLAFIIAALDLAIPWAHLSVFLTCE